MDKIVGVYFCFDIVLLMLFKMFVLSSKKEVGSAGDQPTRDSL
jgi:hypothetical protein